MTRTVKVYRSGVTAGTYSGKTGGAVGKRSQVIGWSKAAARRNTQFLYSIDPDRLTGVGLAVTLTLRDCPPDAEAWQNLRTNWVKRMRRLGMLRCHWVTEWQRRGVPHLHGAIFFPDPRPADEERARCALRWGDRMDQTYWDYPAIYTLKDAVIRHWLAAASEWRAGPRGQQVDTIDGFKGWALYLARHASRGVNHYQRTPDAVPDGWKSTGRLWGYVGEWPRDDALSFELSDAGWYAFRRLVRSWVIADARSRLRAAQTPRQIRDARRSLGYARRLLHSNNPDLSPVRGVSEWIDRDDSLRFIHVLAALGHEVQSQ